MNGEHGYPRPQLERAEWFSLDGEWEFALDPEAEWKLPEEPQWDARIRVPFSPETPASGIGDTGFYRACWYRRQLRRAGAACGASGCCCTSAPSTISAKVWVNGAVAAEHEGGYTPFAADITDYLGDGAADRRRAGLRRSRRSFQAARQAGLAASSRTPSGIPAPPASGRRSGWRACRETCASTRSAGRPTWSAGRSASRPGWTAKRRDGSAARREAVRRATAAGRRQLRAWSPTRCTAASRCPTRASTITATSCCGARRRPT